MTTYRLYIGHANMLILIIYIVDNTNIMKITGHDNV